jgi:hypothetical protein
MVPGTTRLQVAGGRVEARDETAGAAKLIGAVSCRKTVRMGTDLLTANRHWNFSANVE